MFSTFYYQINNSSEGLQKFKDALKPQIPRIIQEIRDEDERKWNERIMRKLRKTKEGDDDCSDFDINIKVEDIQNRPVYVPPTFEGMMEIFGINLKRKMFFNQFQAKHEELAGMTKRKEVTTGELMEKAEECREIMTKLMELTLEDSGNIINVHN